MQTQLCPAQQQTFDQLDRVMPLFPVLAVVGHPGSGKSTILRAFHERTGGQWISMRELLQAFRTRHPLAMEEAVHEIIDAALSSNGNRSSEFQARLRVGPVPMMAAWRE